MLDNIIQKHGKNPKSGTENKFRKTNTVTSTRVPVLYNTARVGQYRRATRVPVLCNTARVVTYPETHIFLITGDLTRVPVLCNTARVVMCPENTLLYQHRRATRVPVLCNTARVAERVQDFPEPAAAQNSSQTRENAG